MTKHFFSILTTLVLAFCIQSCQKKPATNDVITLLPKQLIISADDTSRVKIYANIPWQGAGDIVTFNALRGSFVGGTAVTGTGNTINQTANVNNLYSGFYTAVATYIPPLAAGTDTITAFIQNVSYQYVDTIPVVLSAIPVFSISLNSSASSVTNSTGSTATITGILSNASGYKVSLGTPVSFSLLTRPTSGVPQPVSQGVFFPTSTHSDQNSTVTTTFNPAALDTGSYTIQATSGTVIATIPINVN